MIRLALGAWLRRIIHRKVDVKDVKQSSRRVDVFSR